MSEVVRLPRRAVLTDAERVRLIDEAFSHIWMVRTFLKHSEEAAEDEELREVHRTLYDVMHAVGPAYAQAETAAYLKQIRKKLSKLKQAEALFVEIQPEISGHTNFQMCRRSLEAAVRRITELLGD